MTFLTDYTNIPNNIQLYGGNAGFKKGITVETFNHRKTTLDNIVAFNDDFVNNPINIQRWNSFNKNKKVSNIISLKETIDLIKILFMPIVESIEKNEEFDKKWSKDKNIWE